MAVAMKCDRCGKLYDTYDGIRIFNNPEKANGILLIDRNLDRNYWSHKSYDLCIDCMRKLESFLKKEEVEK